MTSAILVDVVKQYDDQKKKFLVDLWTKIILSLGKEQDHKKILSFLNKVGIVNIDENKKLVFIGIPNEFVLMQVRKFFWKPIKKALHEVYSPHFDIKLEVYEPFSKSNDLLIDIKKILNIKNEKKQKFEAQEKKIKHNLVDYFGILFDPVYTFDNFITGNSNNLAFSAAKAVVENPWNVYNPLFLYGDVGLGKTHLMQAIWNKIMQDFPDKVVIYLPVVKLIDEIVMALRKNKIDSLIRKFSEIDVLMIDDAQFLANKDRTQEIFHNIFNEFHMQKKQVILSSDRPPKELLHIEPRLKSRFALGVVVDLKSPDYETRLAILQAKLEQKNEYIDLEVLGVIAEAVKSNVRELEWALNILLTKKTLLGKELVIEDAFECLETLWYTSAFASERKISQQNHGVGVNNQEGSWMTSWWHAYQKQNFAQENSKWVGSYSTLVDRVAEYYTISVADIKSESRKKEIVIARQLLMYLAKKYFHRTFEKIWDFFGGKNHASVIYAVNTIEKKLKTDEGVRHDYSVFLDWLD